MTEYPELGLEVRGVAASKAGQEAPASLAQHYHLNARKDHAVLMEHLARNRADACRRERVPNPSLTLTLTLTLPLPLTLPLTPPRRELQADIDPKRLVVTAEGRGHEMKTEFIPLDREALRRKRRDGRAAASERRGTMAEVARKKVMKFMEDNDVFFNGARERATKESRLGIEQACTPTPTLTLNPHPNPNPEPEPEPDLTSSRRGASTTWTRTSGGRTSRPSTASRISCSSTPRSRARSWARRPRTARPSLCSPSSTGSTRSGTCRR